MLPTCRTPEARYPLPPCDVSAREVEGCLDALRAWPAAFRACFGRSAPRDHCLRYRVGQCSTLARPSIEPMALQVDARSVRATSRGSRDVPGDEPRLRAR